jgi:hypothetical protein
MIGMLPHDHDPHFTFRFADDRLIPRFHLEGVEAGRRMEVFKIDPGNGERLGLLATAIIVRVGESFNAVPEASDQGDSRK